MKPTCLFSHYGSKSQLVRYYPKPKHDLIVEPFAGGACYALAYADRDVHINELNPRTYTLWKYLIDTPPEEIISSIPRNVKKGDLVTDFAGDNLGLLELLSSNCNMGTMGTNGRHRRVTWFAEIHWGQIFNRLEYFLPKIRHWKVTNVSYELLDNKCATWFIDPPYSNVAGKRYAFSNIDYTMLRSWCLQRFGQTIVCENDGANWLDFKPLVLGKPRGGARRALEVIWEQESL